jgi:serine/threonine-protein phosphatase 2A regulatory subunit B
MNLDRSTTPANGSPGGMGYLSPSLSNGNALKPGGLPLLRLPVVVVLNSVSFMHLVKTYSTYLELLS